MKAIVTGVAGFVGHNIARRLISEGHDVVGVDALTDYYDRNLKRANLARVAESGGRFEFIEGDVLNIDLQTLFRDVDWVFHQAGQPGVRSSWGSEFQTYTHHNVDGTQALLEAASRSNTLSRFVYASSSSVYGDAEQYPTRETDLPRPNSPYGVTKLAAEHLCGLYARNYGTPTISLRYFTVYGPRQRPDMAFTRFTLAAATGGEIVLYGDGEQERDFTFIDDVVDANLKAAVASTSPGTVVNVAGGDSATVNEVLSTISEISGRQLKVRRESSVAGDVRKTGGDTTRVRELLGWVPSTGLRHGLTQQYEWAASHIERADFRS